MRDRIVSSIALMVILVTFTPEMLKIEADTIVSIHEMRMKIMER